MSRFDRIAVIGAGAWGTALANALARAGRTVALWARDAEVVGTMKARGENPRLPGVPLDPRVAVTADLSAAAGCDAALLVVPAQAIRSVGTMLSGLLAPRTPVVVCAKGIERGTQRFMSEVVEETLPATIPAILSGPSFAADVARGLPTAVTLAARDEDLARDLAGAFGSATFRPYHSTDVRGVEIGGAAKNVLAIAAGIVAGRGLGASAAAALTTRGFAELVRFGRVFGARPETLTGLSGLGDLILTCSSAQSRNFSLGREIGRGRPVHEIRAAGALAEGAFTASVLVALARQHHVEMPIAIAVDAVLEGALGIDAAIDSLLTRPLRGE